MLLKIILKNKGLVIGASAVFLFLIFAPLLATHDPIDARFGPLQPSSANHWLGTDRLGRDVWSRLVIGGQRSLLVATISTSITIVLGGLLGVLDTCKWYWVRESVSILMDALLAIPSLLLALVVIAAMEAGLLTIALAVGLAYVAIYAKATKDILQTIWVQPHIEGAYSIGASRQWVLIYHVLPIALPQLAAFAAVIFSWSLLYSAALSFLGFWGNPSLPDWGLMLAQGRQNLEQAPQLVLYPGVALTLTVWGIQRLAQRLEF